MSVPPPPPAAPPPAEEDELRPGGRSVVDILAEEHRQLCALADELADPATGVRRRRELRDVLSAVASRHLCAEEQYLYPAAARHGVGSVERELAADAALLRVLRELTGVEVEGAGRDFAALATEVAERLVRHSATLERDIVPGLRAHVSAADLIRLGNRVEIAEEAAPTRPHPDTPDTPPWNLVVEPAVGVVDKVRDAVTGRSTYPDDLEPPAQA